ncbi:GNAT family N-acetyltransferase [Maritimibacter fusiformis]|uniref:GNAT family N-acetyltransferase n=1 Tax=Maritimibacter fusiformis TaxID=2603819 RepID=A0A5D0RN31_9RHOB|nr:GNAT family N-acetyltransferase [Maritimibacter fusiformis]TYB82048.1 GNAT family N-acetyltransferase [Maritimibacter fusiformis]
MLRAARAGDEPAIEAFLAAQAETSMFLRANLEHLGLFDRVSPTGTAFHVLETANGISGVFGLSNAGFVLCQAPHATDDDWSGLVRALAGRAVSGIAGEAAQVERAKDVLGLRRAAYSLDDPEPLYRLDLATLTVPEGPGKLRKPDTTDRDLLFRWTRAYSAELHMSSARMLDEEAHGRTDRAIASGDARLLIIDGTPVAMTALNARAADMVQIGGVFTPPDLRGRGHARRAVALHLHEVRQGGVRTAILFASGPAACRAYEAIGFERIGRYTLAILTSPVTLGRAP